MAKTETVLMAEIDAIQPNDPTNLVQSFIREALATLTKCNTSESLKSYQFLLISMGIELVAVDGGADASSISSLQADRTADPTGLTQRVYHEWPKAMHRSLKHPTAFARLEAFNAVALAEVDAKIAAL